MEQFGTRIDLRIPSNIQEYLPLFQDVCTPKDPHIVRKMWRKLNDDLCGECFNWAWNCECSNFPKRFNMLKPFQNESGLISTSIGLISNNEMYSILHYFPGISLEDIDMIYAKYRRIRRILKLTQNRRSKKIKKLSLF
jgi:hypothetical protein